MKTVKTKPTDFQTLKAELDTVLDQLQQPDTDVDATLKGYQRGLELIDQLEDYLKSAENQIIKIPANQE